MKKLSCDDNWSLQLEIDLPKNSFTHCGKTFDWDCVFQFWVYNNEHAFRNTISKKIVSSIIPSDLPFNYVPGHKTSADIWITCWGKIGSKHVAGTFTTR
jgi:hypothetical protein